MPSFGLTIMLRGIKKRKARYLSLQFFITLKATQYAAMGRVLNESDLKLGVFSKHAPYIIPASVIAQLIQPCPVSRERQRFPQPHQIVQDAAGSGPWLGLYHCGWEGGERFSQKASSGCNIAQFTLMYYYRRVGKPWDLCLSLLRFSSYLLSYIYIGRPLEMILKGI